MSRLAAGGPVSPIPVTIVTGFLGSGKTTLLRGLVERRQTRRLALLINEFGEVSIDGSLLREGADDQDQVRIHDFPHGLIAYGDDELFIPTMTAIAARRAQVDHVLIETSGLALPTAVMALLQSPALAADFILDATLVVVDAPLLLSGQFDGNGALSAPEKMVAASVASLFERQLEFADVVVLNKIDELDEDALLKAETFVRSRAPNVRFLELAYQAQLDIRLALGLRLHQPAAAAFDHDAIHAYTPLVRQGPFNGHAHSGLGAHSHGLATHRHFHEQDPGWLSFVLRCPSPQDPGRVRAALFDAARLEPVLRCKGWIRVDAAGKTMLVQGVRTRVALSGDGATVAAMSELVFIGYHVSRSRVAAQLSAITGTAWK